MREVRADTQEPGSKRLQIRNMELVRDLIGLEGHFESRADSRRTANTVAIGFAAGLFAFIFEALGRLEGASEGQFLQGLGGPAALLVSACNIGSLYLLLEAKKEGVIGQHRSSLLGSFIMAGTVVAIILILVVVSSYNLMKNDILSFGLVLLGLLPFLFMIYGGISPGNETQISWGLRRTIFSFLAFIPSTLLSLYVILDPGASGLERAGWETLLAFGYLHWALILVAGGIGYLTYKGSRLEVLPLAEIKNLRFSFLAGRISEQQVNEELARILLQAEENGLSGPEGIRTPV